MSRKTAVFTVSCQFTVNPAIKSGLNSCLLYTSEFPFKFEAGTPDYIGTTALAKALDYVSALGVENVATHEHELTPVSYTHL